MRTKLISFAATLLVVCATAYADDARYALFEFTMDGCPACVAAQKDVAALAQAGVATKTLNVAQNAAAKTAARALNVTLYPTFYLQDETTKREVARWTGAGRASEILHAIASKYPPIRREEIVPAPTAPQYREDAGGAEESGEEEGDDAEEAESEAQEPPREDTEESEDADAVDDFRERPVVYEEYDAVGFLDRSRDLWENRDRDDQEEKDDDARGSETRLADRLADRIGAKLAQEAREKLADVGNAVTEKIENVADDMKTAVEERVNAELQATRASLESKFDDVRAEIAGAIKERIEEKIEKTVATCGKLAILAFVVAAVYFFYARAKKEK